MGRMHEFGFSAPIIAGRKGGGQRGEVGVECGLHPLIHTLAGIDSTQDIVGSQSGV